MNLYSKKWFVGFYLLIVTGSLLSQSASSEVVNGTPNILLIAVDDLRPEVNCYGATHMQTPNIDWLSQEGLLFE